MLRLSLSIGEHLQIGPDIRIGFIGRTDSHLRIIIDAPKEVNIARSKAIEKHTGEKVEGFTPEVKKSAYKSRINKNGNIVINRADQRKPKDKTSE